MNPNNYRSHASTVQIYTKKCDDESIPLAVPVVGFSSRNDETRAANPTVGNGSVLRNRSSTKNLSKKDRERRKDDEKSIYTIESLTSEVESVQLEINEVLATASQSETEFIAAEGVLLAELDQLRDRKKVDDQQRSQIRSEAKALEDSKRSLETTKVKVEKRYNQLLEEFNRKNTRRQKWQQEISQSKETLQKLDSDIEDAKVEAMKRIQDVKKNISTCQAELFTLEEETKALATDCRRVENQRTATLKVIEECAENTDKTTGIVHLGFLEDSVLSNELVDQRLKDVLKSDVHIDAALEDGWQKAQKELEVRYLDVKQRYEEAYNSYYEAVNKYDNHLRSSSNNSLVLDSLNAATTAQGSKRTRSQRKNKSLPLNISEMSVADNSLSPPPQIAAANISNNSPHRSHSELYYPSGLSIDTSTSLMNNNSNNASSGSNRGSGESSDRSQLMNDNDNLMSPNVDMLLPSNLFANADDVHEPIPPPYSNSLFDDNNNSEPSSGRPSGSILGSVLQQPGQGRTPSFGSGTSPKPSLLSMREQYNDGGAASPILPSSPQGSFQTFPLFHRATAPNSFTSPPPAPPPPTNGNASYMQTQQKTSPPNTAKKLSNMFFFGRRSDGRTTEHQTDNALFHPSSGMSGDTWSVHSGEIAPIGSRRRTGSYSSLGNNSNSFLGPWNRDTVNPADNNSLLLAPSHSNNGSTVSLESSKFGGVLNGSSISLEPTTSSLWKQQNADSDNEGTSVPQVLVNDHEYNDQDQLDSNEFEEAIHDSGRSVDSKGSIGSGGMGNKFSKGFAGLFSSSNNSPNDKLPVNTEKSIASLFGKSSDDEESRENIIQKSMRSFSVRKSSNSSTGSTTHNGKFKVRSLSFFGSKKDHLKEDNNEAIVEEDADMDIKEFLADDRDDNDDDDDDEILPNQRSLNAQN